MRRFGYRTERVCVVLQVVQECSGDADGRGLEVAPERFGSFSEGTACLTGSHQSKSPGQYVVLDIIMAFDDRSGDGRWAYLYISRGEC